MIKQESMNPNSFSRFIVVMMLLFASGACFSAAAADKTVISFTGLGWVQYGRVEHSSDTANYNYNGNTAQSSGAQITLRAKVSEKFEGAAGLGVLENHYLAGNASGGSRVPLIRTPYIAEASFTYSLWNRETSQLRLTGGLFPYDYNPDVKNLGLYLLRGPVHPGILISGFETKAVLPIANTLGFRLHHESGRWRQDLILNSETDWYPFYDVSPAYLLNYQAGPVFRVGAGVNFYRYLSIESKLTSPDSMSGNNRDTNSAHPYNRNYIYVDTSTGDTTFISFKGTKLMANAVFDPKPLFGNPGILGSEDLKIYGEVALLGLDNSKAYTDIYGDYKHRMPVMLGINIPAFRLLDQLSLEVEWYGAKYRDDLQRFQTGRDFYPSPLPVDNSDAFRSKIKIRIDNPNTPLVGDSIDIDVWDRNRSVPFSDVDVLKNLKADNWKWSLYGSRTIQGHFKLSFQLANDHFRPGGVVDNRSWEAILSTPKDWYWMTKVAYFF